LAYYECVFIARQDVSQGQVDSLTEAMTEVITSNGGSVAGTESWGLKSLAYRIKKNRKGHYVMMNIEAPHAAINEFDRQMHLNEDIIRHLTIRLDEMNTEPSAMLQSRGTRPGGRRGDDRGFSRDDDRPPRDRDRPRPSHDRSEPRHDANPAADRTASAESTASAGDAA
jgi:small subunit ribosomal protein S6